MIDLRSDTVTKPSKEMLEAMIKAPVGDDVFNEDPTINELQNYA
jgi:threonine aldolase